MLHFLNIYSILLLDNQFSNVGQVGGVNLMESTTSERIKEGMAIRNMKQIDIVEKTGISKGALSSYISGKYLPKQNNIYLIAKALNVSEGWLMGYDVPMEKEEKQPFKPELTKKDEKDIAKKLESTLDQLENSSDALMFDGEPLDEDTRELLKISLENSIRLSKKIAKQKYTPKKYR